MTNGNKIRTMTDEKLAGFALENCECPDGKDGATKCEIGDGLCRDCCEEWLKQEEKDE